MISMKSLQNRIKQVRREEHVLKIPVMMIKPNPYQPRKNFSQKFGRIITLYYKMG